MNAGGNGTANHRKDFTPWNKGGHFSDETRRRMSESHKRCCTEEYKKKISAALKGKSLSEAHRMHISEAKKGSIPVNRKSVLMYDRSGNFVMEFPSITSAAIYLGVKQPQVSNVLAGKNKTVGGGSGNRHGGYTFRYKNENPDR